MTVAELIKELADMDRNATVMIDSRDGYIPIELVSERTSWPACVELQTDISIQAVCDSDRIAVRKSQGAGVPVIAGETKVERWPYV